MHIPTEATVNLSGIAIGLYLYYMGYFQVNNDLGDDIKPGLWTVEWTIA